MRTKQIFSTMNIVSWIIFIGYCIKAGAITIVSLLSLFSSRRATENLYMGIDLSNLYNLSVGHFACVVLILIVLAGLKAYIFYMLMKIFKHMDLSKPFSILVMQLIFRISYIALSVGLIGAIAGVYITWLASQVVITQIDLEASAYIFMAGVVFIVASLFKRAIDIQSENELTI